MTKLEVQEVRDRLEVTDSNNADSEVSLYDTVTKLRATVVDTPNHEKEMDTYDEDVRYWLYDDTKDLLEDGRDAIELYAGATVEECIMAFAQHCLDKEEEKKALDAEAGDHAS